MRPLHRHLLLLAIVAALSSGCAFGTEPEAPNEESTAGGSVDEPAEDGTSGDPDRAPEEEPAGPTEPRCRRDDLEAPRLEAAGADATAVAARVASYTHRCASVVVLAANDPWVASLAAPVALGADAPLLLVDAGSPETASRTLSQLEAEELITVGVELEPFGLPGTELLTSAARPAADGTDGDGAAGDTADGDGAGVDGADGDGTDAAPAVDADHLPLALRVADHLGAERLLAVGHDDAEARAAALSRLEPDVALLPLPEDPISVIGELPPEVELEVLAVEGDATTMTGRLREAGADAVAIDDEDLWTPAERVVGPRTTAWLADPTQGASTAVGAVAAAGRGEALLPVDAQDLRAGRERTDRLRRAEVERTVLVGELTDEADWQLATVLEGEPLPSGGFRLFEDERMVALYGSVETSVLGALGEQGLDEAVERVRTVAEPYGADSARVLPAFEIITTIASADEEPTGDYSRRTAIEVLRPWVDRAAEEGIYVFLDLQPGRTDFLTQAKEYEELLREPHVGLALDPEWRLGPEQFHLEQIGSVAAAEVQEVADWLAALTREHQLPEKLLVLHQFRFSMLPDRDTIVAPPELAVVVHMDGQGPIAVKYDTYDAITAGVEDRWLWGWKNFYDEDTPTPTPAQVLELDPLPVLVTYQ